MPAPRILIVDDDDQYALLVSAYLRLTGLGEGVVEHAHSTAEGIRRIGNFAPHLVFLDNRIPPQLDFRPGLQALRQAGYAGPVIVQSACTADEVFEEAQRLGAAEVIDKFNMSEGLLVSLLKKHAPHSIN